MIQTHSDRPCIRPCIVTQGNQHLVIMSIVQVSHLPYSRESLFCWGVTANTYAGSSSDLHVEPNYKWWISHNRLPDVPMSFCVTMVLLCSHPLTTPVKAQSSGDVDSENFSFPVTPPSEPVLEAPVFGHGFGRASSGMSRGVRPIAAPPTL